MALNPTSLDCLVRRRVKTLQEATIALEMENIRALQFHFHSQCIMKIRYR